MSANLYHVLADIEAERWRQMNSEGWTSEHDDSPTKRGLARAAACYLIHERGERPLLWPWAAKWWKPSDRRRDLVKAGALIVAEIERLDRAADTEASS